MTANIAYTIDCFYCKVYQSVLDYNKLLIIADYDFAEPVINYTKNPKGLQIYLWDYRGGGDTIRS